MHITSMGIPFVRNVMMAEFTSIMRAGGVKYDTTLGYTLVDLNNLGHKTPPKNYKDTYDEVDEEFSTVIHQHNDNILPRVDRCDLAFQPGDAPDDVMKFTNRAMEITPKKRTTRASPATTTTTTSVTNTQLKALIVKGVVDILAARDADRNTNGDDSHNSGMGVRRNERVSRECTYLDFMKTVGHDVAYAMTWTELKKKMTDKYCPRSKIKKLEELALLCVRMFPEESDKIERYVGGLPDMIYGSVVASKPKTIQEAIEMATELMDKKIHTFAEHQTEKKRKQDDNNNQTQQQPPKKLGVAIAYTAWSGERKEYAGTLPLCNKCKFHHNVHYKNQNHGNQAKGNGESGVVHALGGGETNQDLNNMEDDINKKVGPIAYKLELPQDPNKVQNTFHVSNLEKCYSDDPLAVLLNGLDIEDELHFIVESVKIMDREGKRLKRSRIPIVKVRWNSRRGPEFTWEREDQIRKKYPHLFTKTAPSSSAAS
ncbi:hypothetical protein Tco_1420469 [Tanacetum coccineum]